MESSKLKEAIEIVTEYLVKGAGPRGFIYAPVPRTTKAIRSLLDAARTAETAEARIRTLESTMRKVDDLLSQGPPDKPDCNCIDCQIIREVRSLAPARECVYTLTRERMSGGTEGTINTSCGHMLAEDDVDFRFWGFCPFKGCGAKIRVEGE